MKTKRFLKRFSKIGLITVFALLFTVSGYAATSTGAPDFATSAGYGSATHYSQTWQSLGVTASNQYGVFWNILDPTTGDWSGWNNTTKTLKVGQSIKFQFNMFKYKEGTHYADHLKAWVDWGQNDKFGDDNKQGTIGIPDDEQIIYKEVAEVNQTNTSDYVVNRQYSFETDKAYEITDNYLGDDLWLRARVTCSESLLSTNDINSGNFANYSDILTWSRLDSHAGEAYYSHNNVLTYVTWKEFMVDWEKFRDSTTSSYEDMFAASDRTGEYYWQGEVEDLKFTIEGGTNSVPEPAAMILFGFGLIGLARVGRSKK